MSSFNQTTTSEDIEANNAQPVDVPTFDNPAESSEDGGEGDVARMKSATEQLWDSATSWVDALVQTRE